MYSDDSSLSMRLPAIGNFTGTLWISICRAFLSVLWWCGWFFLLLFLSLLFFFSFTRGVVSSHTVGFKVEGSTTTSSWLEGEETISSIPSCPWLSLSDSPFFSGVLGDSWVWVFLGSSVFSGSPFPGSVLLPWIWVLCVDASGSGSYKTGALQLQIVHRIEIMLKQIQLHMSELLGCPLHYSSVEFYLLYSGLQSEKLFICN